MGCFLSLWADFITNDDRTIHKYNHYFPIYERYFGSYVGKPVTFLEIGCGQGGSLQMWKRYFGPLAQIIGIDIRPECTRFEQEQIAVRIGSQQDTVFLDSIIEEFGPLDIVLDDGSHVMSHVMATFEHLYPKLIRDGIYMVEDLETAYMSNYEGGLNKPGTFIEHAKHLIDELNADHTKGELPPTLFTRSTTSMHFYDGVIVFERGPNRPKRSIKTGIREGKKGISKLATKVAIQARAASLKREEAP